jgi:hypothetical protein
VAAAGCQPDYQWRKMSEFTDCGYFVVQNFFDKNACEVFATYALLDEHKDPDTNSFDVPNAHFRTNDPITTAVLIGIQDRLEEITGLSLVPTSSHFRIYRKGSKLVQHHDQPECCQVTASINIGSYLPDEYEGYPVYLEDHPFFLGVGDALLFRGHELNHSRDLFNLDEKYYQIQVFVHYVEATSDMVGAYPPVEGADKPWKM